MKIKVDFKNPEGAYKVIYPTINFLKSCGNSRNIKVSDEIPYTLELEVPDKFKDQAEDFVKSLQKSGVEVKVD